MVVLTYEGFALCDFGRGYRCCIDDEWISFDTAGQWKAYIDMILRNGKRS